MKIEDLKLKTLESGGLRARGGRGGLPASMDCCASMDGFASRGEGRIENLKFEIENSGVAPPYLKWVFGLFVASGLPR